MTDQTPPAETTPEIPAALTAAPGYQVRRLYQAYLAVWGREVDPVLTGPQFAVLQAVEANPGRDQRSMAAAVSLDTSTMADVARRLETRGLLARRPDAADGRRKLLYLTDAGSDALREANDRARMLDKILLESFGEAERAPFMATLRALADHWERLAEGS
ncbi:MarR family winged helix-turn-helix transcriptional regulator [Streptomyces sparsogenes]|uniref:MarR family transcriptional regulator n=1 Tax=Streptomyces sparsogenes DSM 40356 TaxID=1331668 RepID=A0A1R1SEH8_9ACTN|nr:MarR family winged helix-turn-helix transcriptional regulator [Streptomyces sparsogenes]OMI36652.1 MarR family transcriptional regulator [Streptomyces sparsogenes DSM 40356]